LKREIVAASLVPGASVSSVARHYDVNANMVFSWRKRFAEIPEASSSPFVPVVVTPDAPIATAPAPSGDMIEIELPRGYRVRLGGRVKATMLRQVLDALERR
jgi:transposase